MSGQHRRARVPRPERLRSINGVAFGWIDARLWRREWLRVLSPEEITVYVFLCLVADRQGVSFYRRDRIAHHVGLEIGQVDRALRGLRDRELLAYEPFSTHAPDGFHQVLALPDSEPPCPAIAGLWQPKTV